jgi:hypothetical protein
MSPLQTQTFAQMVYSKVSDETRGYTGWSDLPLTPSLVNRGDA